MQQTQASSRVYSIKSSSDLCLRNLIPSIMALRMIKLAKKEQFAVVGAYPEGEIDSDTGVLNGASKPSSIYGFPNALLILFRLP